MSTSRGWVWHPEGFEGILNCEGASAVCQQEAMRIMATASSAGGEYSVKERHIVIFKHRRVAWYVKAADREANKQCAENKVLERAI